MSVCELIIEKIELNKIADLNMNIGDSVEICTLPAGSTVEDIFPRGDSMVIQYVDSYEAGCTLSLGTV